MPYFGSDILLQAAKAAVLNSRQSKFPLGTDRWVQATAEAMAHLQRQGLVLLTSLEMNTWELTLAHASHRQLDTLIVMPEPADDPAAAAATVLEGFRLSPQRTGFLYPDEKTPDGKKGWPDRDSRIIELAALILPVSIRPDGALARLLADYHGEIDQSFSVPYYASHRSRPRYDKRIVDPAVWPLDLVVHFTRSCPAPWPKESLLDFYDALIASTTEWCRSARNGLRNIVRTGTIFASNRHIHGGFRIVAFSSLTESNLRRLFRYRPRLVNPGLEPYGIAISREAAIDLGLKPVQYGLPDDFDRLDEATLPYFQHQGSHDAQWRQEQEWRFVGDLHLKDIPRDLIRVVAPTSFEAEAMRPWSPYEVVHLFAS